MKGIQFAPRAIAVKVGQRITWTNDDDTVHDVAATDGASFKSKTFGKGGTFRFTPTAAGKISYVCTLHPGMDGTITVSG
jgi:plastocyanin